MHRFTFVSLPAGRLARAAPVAAGLALAAALAGAVPALAAVGAAAARTTVPGGTWGSAREVPGLAALNAGGNAQISSMSCASVGNCSAGGSYTDGAGHMQAFVVSQAHGSWGTATRVPGLAALNTGGDAAIGFDMVSCASAGNCSAAGPYFGRSHDLRAFVVSQQHGRWGRPRQVTGPGLNTGTVALIEALSCGSAGNCSAGGFYADRSGHEQAFVVNEAGGIWGTAQRVPGLAAVNAGGQARVNAVSCASAGHCTAGGYYTDRSGHQQPFAVTEAGGIWGRVEQVPGLAALNAGGQAELDALSCASAGHCSAAGYYTGRPGHLQAFVVTENRGRWGNAGKIRGAAVTHGGEAVVGFGSLSCAPAGDCSAGGAYSDSSGRHFQVFVVSQQAGRWGTAEPVPGTAALNTGRNAQINSLSCAPAGHCSAAGYYTDRSGHWQAFIVSQGHGAWGTAEQVPGTAALNTGGNAGTNAVSCASAGHCSAGGFYTDRSGHQQAFVVGET